MNYAFFDELEGRLVTIEFLNGESKKGRIIAFHLDGYVVIEGSQGYKSLIPTTAITAIFLGKE